MKHSYISKNSQVHMSIIDNHMIELYQAAILEERSRIMNDLKMLIQEKTERGDHDTVSIITWVIDRLNKEV